MLAPNQRELLLDGLRPDPGFRLDAAVGTTFSLDLDALLMAPLAFALFDVDEPSLDGSAGAGSMGQRSPDPVALLAAVRSYADQIALYCDAGGIAAPPKERPLFQMLETMIKPVHQSTGAFHPKVWVLRYRSNDGGDIRHRVLVLSRNLTFDRSWDTVLLLEESEEHGAPSNTDGLVEFLEELEGRVASPIVRELLRTVPKVSFVPPEPFESLKFWPLLGRGVDPMPKEAGRAVLVVSPFATAGRLETLAPRAPRRALVTRPDTLDQLGELVLQPWHEVFVLHGEAVGEADLGLGELSGLHAKVFVFDDGHERRVFTGSANATTAAFGGNIELIVELRSSARTTAFSRLLTDSTRETTFRRLLQERRPSDPEPRALTIEEQEEDRLESLMRALSEKPLIARASLKQGIWSVGIKLSIVGVPFQPDDRLRARLITAGGAYIDAPTSRGFARCDLPAGRASRVTSLVAIEIAGNPEIAVDPIRTVLVADLRDAPADREDQLLLDLLPDAERVTRMLFLLLAAGGSGDDAAAEVRRNLTGKSTGGGDWVQDLPLFESLVRAYARDPERLRTIKGVIDHLRSTPEGQERFRPGFLELWSTFDSLLPAERAR